LGTPDSVTQIEMTLQSISKNVNSQKRDDAFLIWSDTSPHLSIGQPPDQCQKGKRCQTHTACIDQRIILSLHANILDSMTIRFKFHDRIT
jgi:hypothetical protein